MPLSSTQSPLYSTQSMVATSSDTSATTHTENAKSGELENSVKHSQLLVDLQRYTIATRAHAPEMFSHAEYLPVFALGTVTSQALHISFEAQLGIYKYVISRTCSGNGARQETTYWNEPPTRPSRRTFPRTGAQTDLPKNLTLR